MLLKKSPAGGATAQFLTPTDARDRRAAARAVRLPQRLPGRHRRDACSATTPGFASTLLRIGAAGVVAPLWNVRDDVAARRRAVLLRRDARAPTPCPAAEAMRALRATYTEDGARADDPQLHATLIAYQVFGHPRLRLTTTQN